MAWTLPNASRSAAADAVVDLLDAGAGVGTMVLTTAADAVVATINLNDPAFGAASNGVATMDNDPLPSTTASASGTVTKCKFYDSNAVLRFEGTVTDLGGAGEVKVNRASGGGTAFGIGDTISFASCTYTQPAS